MECVSKGSCYDSAGAKGQVSVAVIPCLLVPLHQTTWVLLLLILHVNGPDSPSAIVGGCHHSLGVW